MNAYETGIWSFANIDAHRSPRLNEIPVHVIGALEHSRGIWITRRIARADRVASRRVASRANLRVSKFRYKIHVV